MPHRIIRSWYTGRWWVSCYIWYNEEGPPPSPVLTVPNVTAHPLTASVSITDGPLFCGFKVAIKVLKMRTIKKWPRSFGPPCIYETAATVTATRMEKSRWCGSWASLAVIRRRVRYVGGRPVPAVASSDLGGGRGELWDYRPSSSTSWTERGTLMSHAITTSPLSTKVSWYDEHII